MSLNISVPHSALWFLGSGAEGQDKCLQLCSTAALMGMHALRLGLLWNTSVACYIKALILLYVLKIMAYSAN